MSYQNILLIDDDEDDREIFLAAVQELSDAIVCTALNSAETALEQLEGQQMSTDLIFLDLNMPIMNGKEFLKEVQKNEKLRQIPVIILSTSSHKGTIKETKELGAHDFITKPAKFSELKELLRAIIG
jgi:CheY-like chemotaxis protein